MCGCLNSMPMMLELNLPPSIAPLTLTSADWDNNTQATGYGRMAVSRTLESRDRCTLRFIRRIPMQWWKKFYVLIPLLTSCAVILSPARTSAQQTSNHHIKTVFIILMENKNWFMIKGNPLAPYINGSLLPNASHTEVYFNPPFNHPSLPNYLWLEAGTNFGIYNDDPPSVNHQSTARHLVTLLENAGVSWKAYAENIDGLACPLTDSYPYAVKHNPFVYFDNVTDNLDVMSAYCIAHVRPFQELATDLMQATTASYNFIIPNVCDDMHDACPPTGNPITDTLRQIKQGDDWLSQNVPVLLGSTAYHQG